jgi:hypothetical protein
LKDENVYLDSSCHLSLIRLASSFLFGRARKVIAENEENEISEEENAQSHEDADDLLVYFHDGVSRITRMPVVKLSNPYANET